MASFRRLNCQQYIWQPCVESVAAGVKINAIVFPRADRRQIEGPQYVVVA
jgi:hypothetical protein